MSDSLGALTASLEAKDVTTHEHEHFPGEADVRYRIQGSESWEGTMDERGLTPTLRALLLAERALEKCRCESSERATALAALRRVIEGVLRGKPRNDEHQTGDHDGN